MEILNLLIRKWKPYFSQICQKVEDWLRLFSRLHFSDKIIYNFVWPVLSSLDEIYWYIVRSAQNPSIFCGNSKWEIYCSLDFVLFSWSMTRMFSFFCPHQLCLRYFIKLSLSPPWKYPAWKCSEWLRREEINSTNNFHRFSSSSFFV